MDGANWTTEDLEAVRAAKLALITGKRLSSREAAGNTVSFQGASLDSLTQLETEILDFLNSVPRRVYAKNGGGASF